MSLFRCIHGKIISGAGDNNAARQADERDKGATLKIAYHLLNI